MVTDSVLLLEGQDDKHVVNNLLFAHHLNTRFNIKEKGGLPNLLDTLPVEIRASELKRIGLVVDADTSLTNRWQSLNLVLTKSGYIGIPKTPSESGTILKQEGKPVLGIWLMPNNSDVGMIEDFAMLLISPQDRLLPLAQAALETIPMEDRLFPEVHRSKALVHTWLAWQVDPGVPMGAAITRKYLESDTPTAVAFVTWLNQLLMS